MILSLVAVMRCHLDLSSMFDVVLLKSTLSELSLELSLPVAVHHFHESSSTNIERVSFVVIHSLSNDVLLVLFLLNGLSPFAEVLVRSRHLSPDKVVA